MSASWRTPSPASPSSRRLLPRRFLTRVRVGFRLPCLPQPWGNSHVLIRGMDVEVEARAQEVGGGGGEERGRAGTTHPPSPSSSDATKEDEQKQSEFSVKISSFANIILLAFKVSASTRTVSIAIAAPKLDSLDLMAFGILSCYFFCFSPSARERAGAFAILKFCATTCTC